MKKRPLTRAAGIAAVALFAVVALAADGNVDAGKSSVIANFEQEGVSVDAGFKSFSGTIVYDAAKPAAATAALDVTTGSLDIGDETYNAEVRKKSWFDSASYPTASFRSTSIQPGAAGQFTATGNLSIKGRVLPVAIPVSVRTAAGLTTYSGSYTLSRKAFGVGDPSWEAVVSDKVVVKFKLVTAAKR
jgi:polyisoprenoid-binding protein YceI